MFKQESIIFKKSIDVRAIYDNNNKALGTRYIAVVVTQEINGFAVFKIREETSGKLDNYEIKKWFKEVTLANKYAAIEFTFKLAQEEMLKIQETGMVTLDV
jgi:hypothetical protein